MTTKNTTADENKNLECDNQSLSDIQNEIQIFEYIPNQPINPYTYKA
jgi:hypothetical protein